MLRDAVHSSQPSQLLQRKDGFKFLQFHLIQACDQHRTLIFSKDLLQQEKVLVVQGTGFNWPKPDHFRIVTLPHIEDLEIAIGRLERFLQTYSQDDITSD